MPERHIGARRTHARCCRCQSCVRRSQQFRGGLARVCIIAGFQYAVREARKRHTHDSDMATLANKHWITVYQLDNQPRLLLSPDETPGSLQFNFIDATGLADITDKHQHVLSLTMLTGKNSTQAHRSLSTKWRRDAWRPDSRESAVARLSDRCQTL